MNFLTSYSIVSAWAKKYGYDDPDEFRQKAQEKFSLIRTGIVDQPSCRLLLLNVCPSNLRSYCVDLAN
jgi:hypothetical protein